MLSVLYPNVYRAMNHFPGGIYPFKIPSRSEAALVVKLPKEMILTAKIRGYFKIYVVPIQHKNIYTVCFLSAFFDDEDEPLVVTTPLLEDTVKGYFYQLLHSNRFDTYFLDEQSREFLSYNCSVSLPKTSKARLSNAQFLDASPADLLAIQRQALGWFSRRNSFDDLGAITIQLTESLYPTDVAVVDMRTEQLSYGGSKGFELSILEREEPGNFQEEDIIRCLRYIFKNEQIFKSPRRTYDNEEICDILVVSGRVLLFIQAKDNPNTKPIILSDIKRKRKKAIKAVKNAIEQTKGAIRYLRRCNEHMEFVIDEELYRVPTLNADVYTAVIVKELFDDERSVYSEQVLKMASEKSIHCVPFDYMEFYKFCRDIEGDEAFFNALTMLFKSAIAHSYFSRVEIEL